MAWNNSEEPRIRFIAPHLNELEIIADHLAYTDPTQLARLASPQTVIPTTRHPIGTLLVHHVVIYATGRPWNLERPDFRVIYRTKKSAEPIASLDFTYEEAKRASDKYQSKNPQRK